MTAIENNQIKELSERIDTISGHLSELSDGVKDIRTAILGNEFNSEHSYKSRLDAIELKIAKIEYKLMKASIWAIAIWSIIIVFFEFIYKYSSIINNLKK